MNKFFSYFFVVLVVSLFLFPPTVSEAVAMIPSAIVTNANGTLASATAVLFDESIIQTFPRGETLEEIMAGEARREVRTQRMLTVLLCIASTSLLLVLFLESRKARGLRVYALDLRRLLPRPRHAH